jgi:hypothetical protein
MWDNRGGVPLERPANLGLKKFYTEEEIAARRKQGGGCAPGAESEACEARTVAQLANVGGYNNFWGKPNLGSSDNRTSLIEDPPDGRIPPLTPEAQKVREVYLESRGPIAVDGAAPDVYGRLTTYRHWHEVDTLFRCIAAQTPTGAMGYNSQRVIMQSPGWVMIAIERLNTRLIPLDNRPHLDSKIRGWLGDSRGRFEGDTLVVETTNFTHKQSGGGVGSLIGPGIPFGNVRLVERFVPMGDDKIYYYSTIEDPTTWTRPWTFMQHWDREPDVRNVDGTTSPYIMHEYACREGDEGVANSLRGTLVEDERLAKRPPFETIVASLVGTTEATVRQRLGEPAAITGPRWEYQTRINGAPLNVYFVGGKVVRVRPDDLLFEQIIRAR